MQCNQLCISYLGWHPCSGNYDYRFIGQTLLIWYWYSYFDYHKCVLPIFLKLSPCDTHRNIFTFFLAQPCPTSSLEESGQSLPDHLLPSERSYLIVVVCVILAIIEIFGTCIIVTFWREELHDKNPYAITVLAVCLFGLLTSVIVVWRQPENKQDLYFKAPLVPWLPFLSMFFNVYLMVSLNKLTWLRFAIWMTIGKLLFVTFVCIKLWNILCHSLIWLIFLAYPRCCWWCHLNLLKSILKNDNFFVILLLKEKNGFLHLGWRFHPYLWRILLNVDIFKWATQRAKMRKTFFSSWIS